MARILLVDDIENVRFALRMTLEGAGHDVTEAANGKQADKLLAQHTFDLVITDIVMPDKEGIQLIMEINEKFPGLKIIAITGGESGSGQPPIFPGVNSTNSQSVADERSIYLRAAATFGADDTLMKPVGIETLLSSVENCLSGKSKRQTMGAN